MSSKYSDLVKENIGLRRENEEMKRHIEDLKLQVRSIKDGMERVHREEINDLERLCLLYRQAISAMRVYGEIDRLGRVEE